MKDLKYILFAAFAFILTGCMGGQDISLDDDWDVPPVNDAVYGNSKITPSNVVSIANLKEMYNNEINTSYAYKKVETNMQIQGVVTSSDITGNVYNEIAVEDETGAIIIAISQGGIYGYLPVGTEILVELKDLYVGNYGKQAEIGTLYTNKNGNTYVSRMSRMLWNDHFKIVGHNKTVTPKEFDAKTWSLTDDSGRLGVIKDVSIRDVTPSSTYADPNGSTSAEWYFNEVAKTVMLYNSPYADFASNVLPQGKCTITGIFKRYNDKWEILIRSLDDVKE